MPRRRCAHCDSTTTQLHGNYMGHWLCHPDIGPSCYDAVTVFREPLGDRRPGKPLHDTDGHRHFDDPPF